MPYEIKPIYGKKRKTWGVFKRDDKRLMGEHSSKRKARAQIYAIEISEGKRESRKPWTHWFR